MHQDTAQPRTPMWTQCVRAAACLLAPVLLSPLPAVAMIPQGGCIDEITGGSNVCSANDVTFSAVGVGGQGDGCVSPSDTVDIRLRGIVRNTTAQERYDIGLWVSVDGDPNGDGAQSGTCAREVLRPVGMPGVRQCSTGLVPSPLDLLRLRDDAPPFDGQADNGPYLNLDGDTCGDLLAQSSSTQCDENGDGLWDDTVIELEQAVTLPCDDFDADGFAEIPTCVTWGNQPRQVGGATCDGASEAMPGTKSKCSCQMAAVDLPVPDLFLEVTAPSTTLNQGDTGTFEATYGNASACTPDLTVPERSQCGTASLVFFVIEYDGSKGTVSNIRSTGGGTFVHQPGGERIVWIPASARRATSGVVGPGDGATLLYDFTYTANRLNDIVPVTARGYWTDTPAALGNPESPAAVEQTSLASSGSVMATPVTLAAVHVDDGDGGPVLRWTTATEAANVGFHVYGEGPDGWRRLDRDPVPSRAVDSTAPLHYRWEDGTEGIERFVLEDVAVDGTTALHGPFEVGRSYGHDPAGAPVDWDAVRREVEAASALAPRSTGSSERARLLVEEDRVYRVRYEDLLRNGVDLGGVPADELALVSLEGGGAEPVPIWVDPAEGPFGPGSVVELLGEARETLYGRTRVYELFRDPERALRIPVDDSAFDPAAVPPAAYTASRVIERDRSYSFASPGDDPWYDTRMLAFDGRRKTWTFEVDLEGLEALDAPAEVAPDVRVEVELWGVTSWPEEDDHHAVVALGGFRLADLRWDGQGARRIRGRVPAGRLLAGRNELTVTLPADRGVPWDIVDLEKVTVTYPRSFDASAGRLTFTARGAAFRVRHMGLAEPIVYRTGPAGPVRLRHVRSAPGAGFSRTVTFPGRPDGAFIYHATTTAVAGQPRIEPAPAAADLDRLTRGSAEYLVVAHPAFLGGIRPLVEAREARGLAVKVANVLDVYDRFGGGVVDPEAIRSYIRHAAREMGTRFVLLVGGDTFDYHDRLGQGSVSFVPSLYAATGSIVRFAPSDPLLTDLDGDRVPDLPIGRLPVRTPRELDVVVEKILRYESAPASSYAGNPLLVADARDGETGLSFAAEADQIARDLPAGWSVRRAYLERDGLEGARHRLFRAIDRGSPLTVFVGHSGLTHWSFAGLFSAADVDRLDNRGAPTLVLQWGCWNTYHVEPRFQTLGHRFLLAEGRGAAGVLGSSTLLRTSSADALSDRLTPLLGRPGVTLGEAVTAAKQALAASDPDRFDALLGWTLLGDPALEVRRPGR